MRRRTIVIIVAAVVAVIIAIPVAAYGYLVWSTRDAPERAALDAAPHSSPVSGPAAVDGTWSVIPVTTNFAGYRIRERLGPVPAPSDAVGRTGTVQGTVAIQGERLSVVDITIDMPSVTSDSPGRDRELRTNALETEKFPTATFRLDEPVELGSPRRGRVIDASVPGELTLHGVTRRTVFEVQARWNGPTIQAAGSTRIQRRDYDIEVDSLGYSVDGTGTIEFELTLAPEGAAVAGPPPTLVDNPKTPTAEDVTAPCQAKREPGTPNAPILTTGFTNDAASLAVVVGSGTTTSLQSTVGRFAGASWSPDGTEVVYSGTTESGSPTTSLAIVPAAGGEPRPLPDLGDAEQPDWGPDGRIVFVKEEADAPGDLWTVAADGSDPRLLVATPGVDDDPHWSPDGRRVVFTTFAGDENNQDIAIVGANGRGLRTITTGETYDYAPSFTPDGKAVVFVRDGSIFRMALDGTGLRRVTSGPNDAYPTISADGTQLAFLRSGSLFVARPGGSGPRCVETGQPIGAAPRWQPM